MIAAVGTFLLRNPLASGLGALAVLLGLLLGVQTVRLALEQSALAGEKLAFANFKAELAEASRKAAETMASKSAAAAERAAETAQKAVTLGEQGKQEIRNVYAAGGADLCNNARGAVVDSVQRVFQARAGRGDPVGQAGPPANGTVRGPAAPGPRAVPPGK